MNSPILKIVMAGVLLLCLAPMPYGYYTLVRFVAAVCFAIFAFAYYQKDKTPLCVAFGALALLFQPFVKVALGRVVWNLVDVAVAVMLVVLVVKERKAQK